MNKHFLLIFLPNEDFNEKEYDILTKALDDVSIEYLVVSSHFLPAHSSDSHKEVVPDIVLERIDTSHFNGFIFLGEKGVSEFEKNDIVRSVIDYALTNKRPLAAIGDAVTVLTRSKLVKGKRITSKAENKRKIEAAGAYYTGKNVENDGYLITAIGPQAVEEWSELLINLLNEKTNFKLEGREYLR